MLPPLKNPKVTLNTKSKSTPVRTQKPAVRSTKSELNLPSGALIISQSTKSLDNPADTITNASLKTASAEFVLEEVTMKPALIINTVMSDSAVNSKTTMNGVLLKPDQIEKPMLITKKWSVSLKSTTTTLSVMTTSTALTIWDVITQDVLSTSRSPMVEKQAEMRIYAKVDTSKTENALISS